MTRIVCLSLFVFTMVWIFEPTHYTRSANISFGAFVFSFAWILVCHNKITNLYFDYCEVHTRCKTLEVLPSLDASVDRIDGPNVIAAARV